MFNTEFLGQLNRSLDYRTQMLYGGGCGLAACGLIACGNDLTLTQVIDSMEDNLHKTVMRFLQAGDIKLIKKNLLEWFFYGGIQLSHAFGALCDLGFSPEVMRHDCLSLRNHLQGLLQELNTTYKMRRVDMKINKINDVIEP